MRIRDIVNQLQLVLPKYTGLFSTTQSIASINAASGVATITTNEDTTLVDNQAVTISDVTSRTLISSVSKDGTLYTFTTTEAHDLTFEFPGYEQITLAGFPNTEWNDSFDLIGVPNRNTFIIRSSNTLPVITGTEYLKENRIDGINGRYGISVIDARNFTVEGDFTDGVYDTGLVKTGVRIAGSVNIERSIEQYTEQGIEDLWIYVSPGAATISKDRNAYNDGVATITQNEDVRLRLIDTFTVFIVSNTTAEVTAVDAVDIARHDLLGPILKTLLGATFDTGLSGKGDFKAVLTDHTWFEYNKSILVYQYNFQVSQDITLADQVEQGDTRAFNDISYTHQQNPDTTDLTVGVKLR